MKEFYFLIFLFFSFSAKAQKQSIGLSTLVEYAAIQADKFDAYIMKKGFKPFDGDGLIQYDNYAYQKISKDKACHRILGRTDKQDTARLLFYTNSESEFISLKEELIKNNFFHPKDSSIGENAFPTYQKGNLTINLDVVKDEVGKWYSIKIERKTLPTAASIRYAEDLLQLNSHENLVAVFGAHNVKRDVFYFSEKELNKCTILFPNTSVQVIFIWEDEINNRNISFLVLGGQTRNSPTVIYNGNEFHKWRSVQGVYLGMTLKELQELNGKDLDFYGWETDQPGHVKSANAGNLNLKSLGLQLSCLDCYGDAIYTKNDIINSQSVLKTNSRALVSTMIILPGKNKNTELQAYTQSK